jgi:hypothetical protein
MTLDEVKKLPPVSEERLSKIMAFENTDFSDCPIQTFEELAQFKRRYSETQQRREYLPASRASAG